MEHIWMHTWKSGDFEFSALASQEGLLALQFGSFEKSALNVPFQTRENEIINAARRQISEYLADKRKIFDIPLLLRGTAFQVRVWRELLKIPYGKLKSYSDIARLAGNPKAVRAAGGAAHCNPIAIIVPCHRVVGKNGSLTGFAAGLDVKKKLLTLEGAFPFVQETFQC